MRLSSLRFPSLCAGPVFVVAGWVTCLGVGFTLVWRRAATPGADARAPAVLAGTSSDRAWPTDRCRLLLFVHPQCPCTRATIDELDRIAARTGSSACVRVYVICDPSRDEAWTKSGTWRAACAIPGVEVLADVRGVMARRMGAKTSGTTLCYSPGGDLLFEGGITAARGHAGDNAGEEAIVAALHGERPAVSATPVFGCALIDDDRGEQQGGEQDDREPERAP